MTERSVFSGSRTVTLAEADAVFPSSSVTVTVNKTALAAPGSLLFSRGAVQVTSARSVLLNSPNGSPFFDASHEYARGATPPAAAAVSVTLPPGSTWVGLADAVTVGGCCLGGSPSATLLSSRMRCAEGFQLSEYAYVPCG